MNDLLSAAAAKKNEHILARVEELGGGYVWDAELFAVTLIDVAIVDVEARNLVELVGVAQIAIDCSKMSIDTLREIAAIPRLQSLVLYNSPYGPGLIKMLQALGPDVEVVSE